MSAPDRTEGAPPFRVLSRETLWKGFCTLERVTFETTRRDGVAQVQSFEIEHHGWAAAVLTYDPHRREAVLVRQLRLPQGLQGDDPMSLEIVAGLLDHGGEEPIDAARREAMEEAGLALAHVDCVGTVRPSPGLVGEKVWIYLAEVDLAAARVAEGGGLDHEGEDIEVVVMPLVELARFVDAGRDLDLKTAFAVQTLRVRRPELFL
ncbi:MAG: NUDIX hydrolase [Hyphomicrobiales bacterium]|nr:NUDIX hydrolase [Hyphomicrobiales bacterium]